MVDHILKEDGNMRKKVIGSIALILICILAMTLINSCAKANQAASSTAASSTALSEEKQKKYQEMQDAENDGHRPGLLYPEQVAMDYAADKITDFGKLYDKIDKSVTGDHATVTFEKSGKPVLQMNLYQPALKGKFGIWIVTSWTDCKTNTKHTVE
jgi:hypothetical protein